MNKELTEQEIKELLKNEMYSISDYYSKGKDLAIMCFLDKNIEAVYPLDSNQTRMIRERFGINDEMRKKSLAEVGQIFECSGQTILDKLPGLFRRISREVATLQKEGIINDEYPNDLQKLIFINPNVQSFNAYLSLLKEHDKNIQENNNEFVTKLEIRNVIKVLKPDYFHDYYDGYETAIKLLLDKNNKRVYPLDEFETSVIREKLGINEENIPKTNDEIALMLSEKPIQIESVYSSSIKRLKGRVREVHDLLHIDKLNLSEEDKKLIFVNFNLKEFDDYFDKSKNIDNIRVETLSDFDNRTTPILIEELGFKPGIIRRLQGKEITNVDELLKLSRLEIVNMFSYNSDNERILINKLHLYGLKFNYEKELLNSDTKTQMLLAELGFSVRTTSCMSRSGIVTVGELINMTKDEIKKIYNLGGKSYEEIISKIYSLGLSFKDEKGFAPTLNANANLETITQRRNELLSKGKQLTSERDALLQQESELDSRIASVVQNKGNIQNGVQNGTTKK